jgi:hypothetical protein
MMQKFLPGLLVSALGIGSTAVLAVLMLERDNTDRVMRAKEIVGALQRLEIGKSSATVADSIVAKIGNAPPPKDFGGRYNKENCAASDRLERCSYIILMNNSPVEDLFLKHPLLPRLGLPDWWGGALIDISSGAVVGYSFSIWYREPNGHLGGAGTGVAQELPRFEPAQAYMSDSYSVRRIEFRTGEGPSGFGLISALTPAASADERQRASRIDFSCLAQSRGCGQICEMMPDAWKDFYEKFGHFDVERLGSTYLFCSGPPN